MQSAGNRLNLDGCAFERFASDKAPPPGRLTPDGLLPLTASIGGFVQVAPMLEEMHAEPQPARAGKPW